MMGRKRKAILGAILPIGVVLFWLVLFLTGNISLTSIGDIVSPLLLFVGLIFLYADGEARVK
ncbi:hypothetical protein IV67_GL000379 [Weissella minor]|uniref:Uncharacterized protein n=2 Tax=Weissella minor TaxID=1620 RepID=A0A0R2JLW9_9LACO|nr:hypothetical protein IV67_GL000379 [Weissella minor]